MSGDDKLKFLKQIRRSFSVFRVDCGSCNGCEIEIFATLAPQWDPERFGFKLVANPRHADILLVTGPVTRQMYYPLLRAYEAIPEPKIVVALGACGSSGGIFYDSYAVWGGAQSVIPVDVFIPGCPPHPAGILYGLASALGLVDQKLKEQKFEKSENFIFTDKPSLVGDMAFEKSAYQKAKFLMSYVHADELYDKFMDALRTSGEPKNPASVKTAVLNAISAEEDPRFKECLGIIYNDVYGKYFGAEKIDPKSLAWA
ncbi:MAG: NADH-quinone oxidoreductase subunit B family protein [Campylobacter sp.]|nr:NADH-quinone oxidoreductase subunit B family protein [Campylobacter sp.]